MKSSFQLLISKYRKFYDKIHQRMGKKSDFFNGSKIMKT